MFAGGWVKIRASHLGHFTSVANTEQGRLRKEAELHAYLSGDEFRTNMEKIIQTAEGLQALLGKERRQHEGAWTRRKRAYEALAGSASAVEEAIRAIMERPASAAATRRPKSKGARRVSVST